MMSLQDVIAQHSAGGDAGPPQTSLQLLVNRFSYRYDADLRDYVETTLLRLLSGGVQPRAGS